jgi:hypothetical protein
MYHPRKAQAFALYQWSIVEPWRPITGALAEPHHLSTIELPARTCILSSSI